MIIVFVIFFFQAEDGIRDLVRSRGLGDVYKRQVPVPAVRSGTDKLKWIEAYDDYTLVFFHKEALPILSLIHI